MPVVTRDVKSLSKSGEAKLKGDVTLSEGANVTLTQSGQNIEIASTGAGGGAPTDAQYVTLATDATLTNERVLTAGEGIDLTDAGAGSTVTISGEDASDTNKGIASFSSSHFSVASGAVSLVADGIDDTLIDWGVGANQVSAVDVPIADSGTIITATEVEGALQENRTAINLNTTHRTSNGTDHTYIDQDVTTTASPTFDDLTLTGTTFNFGSEGGGASTLSILGSQATGGNEGGELRLYTADDFDTTVNYWYIDAYQDQLRINTSAANVLKIDNTSGLLIDNIGELTATNGVVIDSIKLKDGNTITTTQTDHISIEPGTSKLVKIAALRQENTTNVYENGTVILTGWGYIGGNNSSDINESVSFGVTFTDEPIINVSFAGSSAGTDYTNLTGNRRIIVNHSTQSTSSFTLEMGYPGGTLASGTNYFYTWTAIGTI